MTSRPDRDRLRGALYGADPAVLTSVLTDRVWPEDALQLLGDAVLVVARQGQNVESQARRCVEALRERGWVGDAELADQIEARLGCGPSPLLRALPVDLEELAGLDRWYRFSDERQRGRARAWLAREGYVSQQPPPVSSGS